MPVVTNVSPYFDDYSEDKNFHKVLFKPGVAVQSRELNQVQTILQNQIKRVGDYLFTDAAKITGSKPSVNLDARTVRLSDTNVSGQVISLSNFLGKYVVGATTDVIGYVDFVFEKDDPVIGDPKSIVISLKKYNTTNNGIFSERETLYFYTSYNDALNKVTPNYTAIVANDIVKNSISTTTTYSKSVSLKNPTTLIEVGDLLVHPIITKPIYVTKITSTTQIEISEPAGIVIGEENIQYTKKGTCPTSIVTQDVAYFYKNGYLVRSPIQKIVPDKNTSYPSKLISLLISEQIITSADDESLLDPAVGSANYFAPGGDRLQINLNIASFDLTSKDKADTTEDHIPLVKFNKGEVEFVTEIVTDGVLQKQLADRTYDESGNYVVNDFLITSGTTLETDPNLIFNISAGKAYIGGYPVTSVGSTELSIPKPTTTETKTGFNITTSQGNYIRIKDLKGAIPSGESITQGELFLELHNVTNPTAANSANTRVGILAAKGLEYDSALGANSDAQYRLFYHYYSTIKEAPATWEAWSAKYNIPVLEGQFIANVLYQNIGGTPNVRLGAYGPSKANTFALFREPGVEEVVYWWQQYTGPAARNIETVKENFALSILSNPTSTDYTRLLSNTKTFFKVENGSPFSDGLLNVKKIKSIVGVSNELTSHAVSETYTAPWFYANVSAQGMTSTGDLLVLDPRSADTLVFPISKSYIKSLTNLKTTYNRVIRNAVVTAGTYTKRLTYPETFALGDGTVVASTARTNFIVVVKTGATSLVPLGAFNFEKGSVTISGESSTAIINLGDPTFTGLVDILYVVESDSLPFRTKNLFTDQSKVIDVVNADYTYSLGIADIDVTGIYKLTDYTKFKGAWSTATTYDYNQYVLKDGNLYKANVPSSNVAVTYSNAWVTVASFPLQSFVISNGQKDGWYDHGYIKYIGSTAAIPGNVLITYNYFTHTGDGPCTVNSYPSAYYRNIGVYKSKTDGKTYNLRDSLDFRPRRVDNSPYLNFDTAVFPTSAVNTEADVTYYIGRVDRVYVSRTSKNFDNPYNNFYYEQGIETTGISENPNKSAVEDGLDKTKLAIAKLLIPPYPRNSSDVLIQYEDNKRYTMRDIGKLEQTTIRLDKAIKLHSIEIQNLKATITNDNGDALLKTGVLVENFTDFSKSDFTDPYFNCALNTSEGECYPLFSAFNAQLKVVAASNYNIARDIITAKYDEEVYASQVEGNSIVNPNPGAVNDGRGRASLSKQNTFKVNLLQTGLVLLMNYMAVAGVVAVYKSFELVTAAYTEVGIWAAAKTAASTFYNGAVGAVETLGNYASAAYNYIVGDSAGAAASYLADAAVTDAAIATWAESIALETTAAELTVLSEYYATGSTIAGGSAAVSGATAAEVAGLTAGAGAALVPGTVATSATEIAALSEYYAVSGGASAAAGSATVWESLAAADPTGGALVVVAAIVIADKVLSDPDKKNIENLVNGTGDAINDGANEVAKAFGW